MLWQTTTVTFTIVNSVQRLSRTNACNRMLKQLIPGTYNVNFVPTANILGRFHWINCLCNPHAARALSPSDCVRINVLCYPAALDVTCSWFAQTLGDRSLISALSCEDFGFVSDLSCRSIIIVPWTGFTWSVLVCSEVIQEVTTAVSPDVSAALGPNAQKKQT